MSDQEFIQGSDDFKAAFAEAPATEPAQAEPQQIPLTVDNHGNIVGGMDGLPEEQIAQLNTPESKARIARMYKDWKYGNTPPPKARPVHENVASIAGHEIAMPPRDLRKHNAPGLQNRIGRKLRRQHQRKLQKIHRKEVQANGRQSDESDAGNGGSSAAESSGINARQA